MENAQTKRAPFPAPVLQNEGKKERKNEKVENIGTLLRGDRKQVRSFV